jgi:cysteine synthase A
MTRIGSSRRSTFLAPGGVDRVVHVGDGAAFAECWRFRRDTGVALGASSGAVLAAARQLLAEEEVGFPPICIAADGGEDYDSTLYHRHWLRDVGHEEAAAVDGPGRWRESGWPSTTP